MDYEKQITPTIDGLNDETESQAYNAVTAAATGDTDILKTQFEWQIFNALMAAGGVGGGGDGSGSERWTKTDKTTATVGGLNAGANLVGQSAIKILEKILYKYQAPSFASASISTFSTNMEVGQPVGANGVLTFTLNNPQNVKANSISLANHQGAEIASGLNLSPANLTFASWTRNSVGQTNWVLKGIPTEGSAFTRNISINWQAKILYGVSEQTELTSEAELVALNGARLQGSCAGEFDWDDPGYKFLCIPKEVGTPTSFTDTGRTGGVAGFVVPMNRQGADVTVVNQYGVTLTYQIWRSSNRLGGKLSVKVA